MVFCGKPSKGCSNCRKRRIKCDQLDPACSQCLRAGKTCEGYRDQLNLMFRDENEKVLRKARVPRQSTPKPGAASSSKTHESTFLSQPAFKSSRSQTPVAPSSSALVEVPQQHVSLSPSPPRPLTLDDPGLQFFFRHYVTFVSFSWTADKEAAATNPLLNTLQIFSNDYFSEAVSSVGYAGLSNVTNDQAHRVAARNKYAKTIACIRDALKHPETADLEAIFKTVVLLAIFEVVSGVKSGATTWGVHLDGASALLKMMATKQPRPYALVPQQRMHLQFLFALQVKCLTRGERCPQGVSDWVQQCRPKHVLADYVSEVLADGIYLAVIIYDFVNLNSDIEHGVISDPHTIIQACLSIEQRLEAWVAALSDGDWSYTVEDIDEENVLIYDGKVHIYKSLWASRVFSHYRWTRTLVNEVAMAAISRLDAVDEPEWQAKFEVSAETVKTMALETCRSIYGNFKVYSIQESMANKHPIMSGVFLRGLKSSSALALISILFPLAVAGCARGIPESMHSWIITLLKHIGNEKGIAQALTEIPLVQHRTENSMPMTGHPVVSIHTLNPKITA